MLAVPVSMPVHRQELLLAVLVEQLLRHEVVVYVGDDEAHDAHDEDDAPVVLEHAETYRRDAGYDHDVEEEVARTGHEEGIGVFLLDDALFLEPAHEQLHQAWR